MIKNFLLKDAQPIKNLVETFKTFLFFSQLKANLAKCDIVSNVQNMLKSGNFKISLLKD